jgi:two-component system OmpR family sensor kinase/two-component system sensor histidine kinase BaeS
MKRSLSSKLILSFLAVALLTVLVVSVVIRLNSGTSLMELVVEQQTSLLSESVKTYYADNGNLNGFIYYYQRINPDGGNQPAKPGEGMGQGRQLRGLYGLVDTDFKALLPTFGIPVGESVPEEKIKHAVAVEVDGQTIAWIIPDTTRQFELSAEEQLFLQRTNLAIGLAALAGVLVAVGMGIFLARMLVKPIRQLTKASAELAQGNLQQQVPVTSGDELGQLSATFNRMSRELARADEDRKRLTADITHDLSTPIQIISGYMEMLDEGQVALTPQRVEILKTELEHLRRLVGDLGTLTQVEAGGLDFQFQQINPVSLLQSVVQTYQPIAARQGITLSLIPAADIPEILVDEGRMIQVLKNLVENALRYTGKDGEIKLSVIYDGKTRVRVIDNGIGIDAEDLPYVFDRFYKAEKARGANSGKMGLGLAICKALVTAQGGEIIAKSEGKGFGTTMEISFP